jgi:hypothetical protein
MSHETTRLIVKNLTYEIFSKSHQEFLIARHTDPYEYPVYITPSISFPYIFYKPNVVKVQCVRLPQKFIWQFIYSAILMANEA